jgi:hypothetical protein
MQPRPQFSLRSILAATALFAAYVAVISSLRVPHELEDESGLRLLFFVLQLFIAVVVPMVGPVMVFKNISGWLWGVIQLSNAIVVALFITMG